MNKKAEIMQQLGALGVGIASLAIVLTVGFLVIVQARAQGAAMEGTGSWEVGTNCTSSATCNATTILRTSLGTVPGWIPLVVIAVIGAALLGLVGLFMKTR